MRPWMAVTLFLSTVFGACSVANPDHCANQQGHATCEARGGNTPYCNKCVADNDGCVAEPVTDLCDAGESSASGTSVGPGGSETTTPTTTLAATSNPDPTTTTTTSGASEGLTTGDLTTGPGPTTTSATTSTTDATSSGDDTGTSTLDFTTSGTDDTAGPVCGDNVQEFPETCDGTDLGQFPSCTAKNPDTYGGGTLACNPGCGAYDESDCCLAPQQNCLLVGQPCCPGTTCQLLGMGLFSCKPV